MVGCKKPGPTCSGKEPARRTSLPGSGHASPGPVGAEATSRAKPHLSGWPRKLKWADYRTFKAPPSDEKLDAYTEGELQTAEGSDVVNEHGLYRMGGYAVQVRFLRENSWVVDGRQTPELLAHEQGHFDIIGLSGRDMVNDLSALKVESVENLQREVKRIIDHYQAFKGELSLVYDQQTDHSHNRETQKRWEARIQEWIHGARLSIPK